jgi:hypothetical protein
VREMSNQRQIRTSLIVLAISLVLLYGWGYFIFFYSPPATIFIKTTRLWWDPSNNLYEKNNIRGYLGGDIIFGCGYNDKLPIWLKDTHVTLTE